jgi:predicted enzyme related to lactoylglutathione lyase
MSASSRFVWHELMTTDPDAAQSFYTEVMGWGIQPFEGHDHMDYTMWTVGDEPIGGVMELPEQAASAGAPPHWMGYVGVDDVQATAARAADLGAGLIVPPQEIPGAGWFAVVQDPHGAVFSLYQTVNPAAEGAEQPPEGPGRVSWNELATTDFEAAFGFYAELFGWTVHEDMDMGPHGTYRIYGPEGAAPLGGMFTKPADMPQAGWIYYLTVGDLDATLSAVSNHGGRVVQQPIEVPGGRIAHCLDPQGAFFALHWKNAD